MNKIASLLVLIAALTHGAFAVAEIFFWALPAVHSRITYLSPADGKRVAYDELTAAIAAPIVQNAGIYNSFLAAGLFWGLMARDRRDSIRRFFLGCALIAGVFGSYTLWNIKPLIAQSAVASAALLAMAFAKPNLPADAEKKYSAVGE